MSVLRLTHPLLGQRVVSLKLWEHDKANAWSIDIASVVEVKIDGKWTVVAVISASVLKAWFFIGSMLLSGDWGETEPKIDAEDAVSGVIKEIEFGRDLLSAESMREGHLLGECDDKFDTSGGS